MSLVAHMVCQMLTRIAGDVSPTNKPTVSHNYGNFETPLVCSWMFDQQSCLMEHTLRAIWTDISLRRINVEFEMFHLTCAKPHVDQLKVGQCAKSCQINRLREIQCGLPSDEQRPMKTTILKRPNYCIFKVPEEVYPFTLLEGHPNNKFSLRSNNYPRNVGWFSGDRCVYVK